MEGNTISAAFTALWRGLSGDKLSADIAASLLTDEQLDVMKRARFAPPLRALVGSRATAVEDALRRISELEFRDCNEESSNVEPENEDARLLASFLSGEKQPNCSISWADRWAYVDEQHVLNQYSILYETYVEETYFAFLKAIDRAANPTSSVISSLNHIKKGVPVVVSLGSGFDTRCMYIHGNNEKGIAWLRVDRSCVQSRASEFCRSNGCNNCVFLSGDVASQATLRKIRKELKQHFESQEGQSTVVWLAEGLMEYLKCKQQRNMLKLLSDVQSELGPKCTGRLIIPILSESINAPLSEHYGARFGWKWSNLSEICSLLAQLGWEFQSDNCKQSEEASSKGCWGTVLEASWRKPVA